MMSRLWRVAAAAARGRGAVPRMRGVVRVAGAADPGRGAAAPHYAAVAAAAAAAAGGLAMLHAETEGQTEWDGHKPGKYPVGEAATPAGGGSEPVDAIFSRAEVRAHDCVEKGVWVT